MATTFKTLSSNDISSTRTLLHEAIPITGSLISGAYSEGGGVSVGTNVKNYSHGMFQSIYDYPYLSSSANHIFDVTIGISPNSGLTVAQQEVKKNNLYNQMAQVLMGHDSTGNIQEFDEDGNILAGGTKLREVYFLNFSRLLFKDEIKKGSFQLELGFSSGSYTHPASALTFHQRVLISDASGSDSYFTNSPAGEYGVLYLTQSFGGVSAADPPLLPANTGYPCGLLFYQAGIAVISASIFLPTNLGGLLRTTHAPISMSGPSGENERIYANFSGSLITGSCDSLTRRIYNLQFNNTTELNSTIYFCRAHHNEFNYSSNPTYLTNSKIRVKSSTSDQPISYITTVGLYSADNELLAVAKLSEPLKKTTDIEQTIRARIDY